MRLPKVKEVITTIYTTTDGKIWSENQKGEAERHQLIININTSRVKVINTIIKFFSEFDADTTRAINNTLLEAKFKGDHRKKLRTLARLLVDMSTCMPRLSGSTQFEYLSAQIADDLEDIKDMRYKLNVINQTSK